ncbi:gamma-glutamylcyclotransferase family protein [Halobaculum sp. EA56]|uniref:gamma-glutamylcyclotransferase family protein n=1 Tax=Halobaculum sp. EA56 TaxID=3421648 RepID=UPI003EB7CDA4
MDVFVYGTLTEPARVREVLDSFAFVGGATLTGLRVVEGTYPTLAPPVVDGDDDDGDSDDDATAGGDGSGARTATDRAGTAAGDAAVGGRLLRTEEVAALDKYEGVDGGLYTRVSLPLRSPAGDDEGEVAVYVGDPDRLDADAAWPGPGPFPERVRRWIRERDVAVRRRPER